MFAILDVLNTGKLHTSSRTLCVRRKTSGESDDLCGSGKLFMATKHLDLNLSVETSRYYAGWVGEANGKTIE